MFRRRWSGLPEDPAFPADLEELGYCVEPTSDEIRNAEDPKYYFHYFRSKNERHNECQRFAFNTAVEKQLIHPRLEALGLTKLVLPLGTDPTKPHVPIFVSPHLESKKRVVLIVGESEQELGVLAHRVIGGAGGVDKGSMVDIARAILQGNQSNNQSQNENPTGGITTTATTTTTNNNTTPGLVLANTGELWWWPEGGRGLTTRGAHSAPLRSAVHWGRYRDGYDPNNANTVPRNGSPEEHILCVFQQVLGNRDLVAADAVVQVVGVGNGAAAVERVLDSSWARWEGRIGCLAMCGSGLDAESVRDAGFKRFLREKARLYITCQEQAGALISGPEGNNKTVLYTNYGTYVFSSGERYYTELALIKAKDILLDWLAEVGRAGAGYVNPEVEVTYADEYVGEGEQTGAAAAAAFEKPTREEQKDKGLEIITREEYEDRLRTGPKNK
ncbi:hypothetical protein KVR01_003498 [Diaporthe batatas]|uniref:uncharacterized protein n=1 Tax=Diaporthe batatas TaxID=748121 RepID=UPI001D03700C|nr:uncharacterized protein KVR01_003498 [Diaporthe batatas]KAG8167809.1 hypothetical protein KVR01_003498 [Diaporthe batatas]